jgi:hypothetical protein
VFIKLAHRSQAIGHRTTQSTVSVSTPSRTSNDSPSSALCETAVKPELAFPRKLRSQLKRSCLPQFSIAFHTDTRVYVSREVLAMPDAEGCFCAPLCPVSALRLATRAQRLRCSTTMRDSVAAGYGAR